jgi:hypothetical protein
MFLRRGSHSEGKAQQKPIKTFQEPQMKSGRGKTHQKLAAAMRSVVPPRICARNRRLSATAMQCVDVDSATACGNRASQVRIPWNAVNGQFLASAASIIRKVGLSSDQFTSRRTMRKIHRSESRSARS